MGANHAGKSSLISRFVQRNQSPSVVETIGIDVSTTSISVFQEVYHIQLIELSHLVGYESLYQQYLINSDLSIVVYDVTVHASYLKAIECIAQTRRQHGDAYPVVLVGNKIDCISTRRIATRKTMGELKKKGNIFFIETSAKDGVNTTECLKMVAIEGSRKADTPSYDIHDFKNTTSSKCVLV